jgi:hypothetical protein
MFEASFPTKSEKVFETKEWITKGTKTPCKRK